MGAIDVPGRIESRQTDTLLSGSFAWSSETLEPSVVSKSPTMAELIPMYNALLIASEDSCERPPAKRRKAVGLMKRNKAIVLRTFSSLKGFSFSNGVPGIGLSRLIGMDWTFSAFSVKANSIRCSIVSPMPMIPPQQISIPTRRAALRVASFCSCVCVEHSFGK